MSGLTRHRPRVPAEPLPDRPNNKGRIAMESGSNRALRKHFSWSPGGAAALTIVVIGGAVG